MKMIKSNKENYIRRLKRKKEDALEFVIDNYLGLVKGCVSKVLVPISQREAIDECVNDVFLSIWNHVDQFQGDEDSFRKWVYRIARCKAIDYYRKLSKQKEMSFEENLDFGEEMSSEQQVIVNEDKEELLKLIGILDSVDQKIFVMKYFMEIESEKIGKQLGLSRTAVDNRLYRGKHKLKKLENIKCNI